MWSLRRRKAARRAPLVPLRPKSRPGGAVGLRDASLRLGVQALIFQNIVSSDCRGHYVDTVGKNTAKIAENSPDSLLQVQQYIRLKELEAELLQSLHCNMKKGK